MLTVQPNQDYDAPLRCGLNEVVLGLPSTAPEPYVALSYVWGAKTGTIPIICEEQIILVTPNCEAALRCIRKQLGPMGPITIWIDAICIDQTNLNERASQVMLMRDIYQSAALTIAWLGAATEHSGTAIRLLEAWAAAAEPQPRNVDVDPTFRRFAQRNPSALKESNSFAIDQLMERSWWKRAWVFQEFVVSKELILFCGSDMINFERLLLALSNIRKFLSSSAREIVDSDQLGSILSSGGGRAMFIGQLRMSRRLRELRPLVNWPITDAPLMDLLALARTTFDLEATDPRDKLYALLGVDEVRDVEVTVDYALSVAKVYIDFSKRYLTATSNLNLLKDTGIGFGDRDTDIPSWVLDFRNQRFKGSQAVSNVLNCASKMRKAILQIDGSRLLPRLKLRGLTCGFVTSFCPNDTSWDAKHDAWLQFALSSQRPHPTGIGKLQAFFRTMTADATGFGHGLPTFRDAKRKESFYDLAKGFLDYTSTMVAQKYYFNDEAATARLIRWREKLAGQNSEWAAYVGIILRETPENPTPRTNRELLWPMIGSQNPSHELSWPEESGAVSEDDSVKFGFQYVAEAQAATVGKSLFLTSDGYMGLGPVKIREGDVVCVVFGCDTPLLLRRSEEGYLLVGEVYVYGMMQGEMVDKLESGGLEEGAIVLL